MSENNALENAIDPIYPNRDKNPGGLNFDKTDNIYLALAKAQGQFKEPVLNREAKVYAKESRTLLYTIPYADLQECISCIRGPLSANGLSFTHIIDKRDGAWLLVLTLRHSSGQLIESCLPINTSQASQQLGSQLTYLKRYQLSAFFGLAADYDDDGVGTTENSADFSKKPNSSQNQTNSKPPNKAPQSQAQAKAQSTAPKQAPKAAPPPANKPPEAEDIPQVPPAVEFQDQSKPENKKGPGDYVIAYGSPKYDGKKIKDLSESELREMNAWIKKQLERVPPPKNMSILFDTSTSIRLFFESMDLKL